MECSHVTPGTIYKNRRHHPDRLFLVLNVKRVKRGDYKTARLHGILVEEKGVSQEASFLVEEIAKHFPLVMWTP